MTDFTIAEDFPRSEIEFDARFSNPDACYAYLFQLKWPDGFVCQRCGHDQFWRGLKISVPLSFYEAGQIFRKL